MGKEFLEWNRRNCRSEIAEAIEHRIVQQSNLNISDGDTVSGLSRQISDPGVLHRFIELLGVLHARVQTDGFDFERDKRILERLYGLDPQQRGALRERYLE
jgi:hypothetical protein